MQHNQRPTKNDILTIIVYGLAIESGFTPIIDTPDNNFIKTIWCYSFNKLLLDLYTEIPLNYHHNYENGYYKFNMELNNLSSMPCLLLIREIGENLCITLTPKWLTGKSIIISSSRYIVNNRLLRNTPERCLQLLPEMNWKLRDGLFVPIRNSLLEFELQPYPGLLGVPAIVFNNIKHYLNKTDQTKLALICEK